jgi:hypothetical protein
MTTVVDDVGLYIVILSQQMCSDGSMGGMWQHIL